MLFFMRRMFIIIYLMIIYSSCFASTNQIILKYNNLADLKNKASYMFLFQPAAYHVTGINTSQITKQSNISVSQTIEYSDNNIVHKIKQLFSFSKSSQGVTKGLNTSPVLTISLFFFLGILIAFTPCVFPLFPILFSIITGKNDKSAIYLSCAYVFGISVSYALAGVVVTLIGVSLQVYLQNIWLKSIIALIMIVFALSMFGLFEIRLPEKLLNSISKYTNKGSSGMLSTFFIGVISSLILSPCVTAPLAGALLYISTSKNIILGATALFVLGFGSGLPLLLLAVIGNKSLPRSGSWMKITKLVLGVILILMAIYTIKNYLKPSIPVFQNSNSNLVTTTKPNNLFNHTITKFNQLPPYLQLARQQNKYIIVDFSASWCLACKEMELSTWKNPQLINLMANMIRIKADITNNDAGNQELMRRFGVFAPPALVIIDSAGNIKYNFVGNTDANTLIQKIKNIGSTPH